MATYGRSTESTASNVARAQAPSAGRLIRRFDVSCPTVIHAYSNETQTRWDRGEFKVQLNQLNNTRPMGYCDGSEADVSQLREIAESEGAEEMRIEKKILKSGREIWTLCGRG